MFSTIFTKTLYNLRWQLLGWGLGIGFVAFITMVFYNSFNQAGIDNIVNSVPDSLKSLIGDVADFKTIPGYIGQQIFGPNIVILTIAMSIIVFVSISASEEDDGRLQSLLSLPVTRTSVYIQKLCAAAFVVAVVSAMIVIGTLISLGLIHHTADLSRLYQSAFDCWVMNVCYGLVAYAAAMITGKKGLTVAIAGGYAAISFIISSLAPAVKDLKTADLFSIFHYYNNPQIMQHGMDGKHLIILLAIAVALIVAGWFGFVRRNVE